MYTKNKNTFKRIGLPLILLIGILIAALFLLEYRGYINLFSNPAPTTTDNTDTAINYDPATDQEVAEGEAIKDETINEETEQDAPPATEKAKVTPLIGYLESDQNGVSANGYVSGFVESDGMCTLSLTKGSVTVTEQKTAMPDAQSTVCGQIVIERSRLTTGTWEVKISYSSAKHEGTSETRTLEVK